ncbi:MAG: hypothetical protein JWQ87_5210 [Candidatus Sulfotelmatobacter sp.]|nr:hypothetical protein [Candidatus Sulfotelmatobacter sp.]
MRNTVAVVLVCLSMALCGFAQNATPAATPNPSTTAPTFTLNASILSLPANSQTSAATDIGATFAVTDKLLLRSDNILAPSVNLSAYFGGIQYALPTAKILTKTNLDPAHFQFYLTGSAGQARVTVGSDPTRTHFAALVGGGVNYDPAGTGKFSINLLEGE